MMVGRKAALIFEAAMMAALLGMLGAALRPGFGGGHLVAVVAALTAGVLAWVMLKESVAASKRGGRAPGERPSDGVEAAAAGARECWLAVFYAVLMFLLVYVLGTLSGCVLFVGAFLLFHRRGNPWTAIFLALVVGAIVPYLLGGLLDARLWEGVIPEIVPGWIGGGVPPPL
jgi:hypothetical protein